VERQDKLGDVRSTRGIRGSGLFKYSKLWSWKKKLASHILRKLGRRLDFRYSLHTGREKVWEDVG
jgi:hypothetical protein